MLPSSELGRALKLYDMFDTESWLLSSSKEYAPMLYCPFKRKSESNIKIDISKLLKQFHCSIRIQKIASNFLPTNGLSLCLSNIWGDGTYRIGWIWHVRNSQAKWRENQRMHQKCKLTMLGKTLEATVFCHNFTLLILKLIYVQDLRSLRNAQ